MFYVVTLSLRTISAVHSAAISHSLSQDPNVVTAVLQAEQLPLQHKVNEELVHSLLLSLSRPIPDHITFPSTRLNVLPVRILLFYLDKVQGRAAVKSKTIDDIFCVGGRYRRIIADVEHTAETELRAFVRAGGIRKDTAKLCKEDLIALIILRNYRRAESERTRVQTLLTRLEEKTEKLQDDAEELKFVELKLADANLQIRRLNRKFTVLRRDSGVHISDVSKHRYPTRYSLTSVVRPEDV